MPHLDRGGTLCHSREHLVTSVVFDVLPTSTSGEIHLEHLMVSCEALCIPTTSSLSDFQEDKATVCLDAFYGSRLATESRDGGEPQNTGGSPVTSFSQIGYVIHSS